MTHFSLILIGSEEPTWRVEGSRDALQSADVLFVDTALPSTWRATVDRPDARWVDVGASDDELEQARSEMVTAAETGRKIVRVHWKASCQDAVVLRDVRSLRDASIAFTLMPGVEAAADDWSMWLAQRPLYGRRIAVLRMRGQASETADLLRLRGADPWVIPTIELHPPPDPSRLTDALRRLDHYDLVAFTSANGVERVFEVIGELGMDARAFGGCGVAAIGTATARRLEERGIAPDVVAKTFRGEALAEAIVDVLGGGSGKRVLIPRALEAREVLPELLRKAGAEVDVVAAYQTLPPPRQQMVPLQDALRKGRVDAVLLTASSTVTNLCAALGEDSCELLGSTCLASIGPITSDRAGELGLKVAVEAKEFTIPGVVAALERYWT